MREGLLGRSCALVSPVDALNRHVLFGARSTCGALESFIHSPKILVDMGGATATATEVRQE